MNRIKSKNRAKIVSALEDTSGWVTANTVAPMANVGTGTARRHLNELAETEAVEKRQPLLKQHRKEYRYVALPEWWDP